VKIEFIRSIPGPNVYHHQAVLLMALQLGELKGTYCSDLPGFNERLMRCLPGLQDHHCSPGRPGGFVERLRRGTFFGHIIEHVALELSRHSPLEVRFGKTVYAGAPGLYHVVVRHRSESGMTELLRAAVDLVAALLEKEALPPSDLLDRALRAAEETALGPSTLALISEAKSRNIPWQRLDEQSLVLLGQGRHRKLLRATTTGNTSDIAVAIAQDKQTTKRILSSAGLPVPKGRLIRNEDDAAALLQELPVPLTVKPLDGHHGQGVTLGISGEKEIRAAYAEAKRFGSAVIAEQFLRGKDFRILVVDGRMIAASERVPPSVTGDGEKSLRQLIEEENRNPARGDGHCKPMTKIPADATTERLLGAGGRSLDSIPDPGETVLLRATANLSTGGSASDVTELVHPETARICERAARLIGLDLCGIDLIASDISQPLRPGESGIIEVNAGPGIRMHHFPAAGKARNAAGAVIDMLFPGQGDGRIPVAAVTGTNGKTTVTRLLAHILLYTGKTVGSATSDGIFLNGERLAHGDCAGPDSARSLFTDPAVELAVLETARGGILRRGLAFDWSDVGVITNIQGDHLGQDGIEDIEDILHIKSLIAERVRFGGSVVLNGDDERLVRLSRHRKLQGRKVVLFSVRGESAVLERHIRSGGTAYQLRDGDLLERSAQGDLLLAKAVDLPVAVRGAARYQIANALAAAAAGRALGVPAETVVTGLSSFHPAIHNSGRANFFRTARALVLLDYGHNPAAFSAVGELASSWPGYRVTGVIGVPGDRSDELIRQCGRAAASSFDSVIIREDDDPRGRRRGETAEILRNEISTANLALPCRVETSGLKALYGALEAGGENEIIVYFYEELASVRLALQTAGAIPIDAPPELELRQMVRKAG
jgi:cyanophycin synthetase